MTDESEIRNTNILDGALRTIARGGALILAGSFISILANFFYQFLLARLLGPGEVGLFNLGISVITLVSLLVLFGLDRTVVRYVAYFIGLNDRRREVGVISSVVRLLSLTTLIIVPLFWITSPLLAEQVFHKPDLLIVLRVLTLGLPFIALTRLLLSIAQAYKYMTPILIIEQITVPALRVAVLFLLVWYLSANSFTASLSFTMAAVLGCVPVIYFAYKIYKTRSIGILPIRLYRELLPFTWLAMLTIILNRTNTQTEILILGVFSSKEQVGLYTVGLKATIFISIFLDAIATVFTPFIAELYAQKDITGLAHQLKIVTRWAFTLALPVAVILFIESPDLMALFGPGFAQGVIVLRILVIAQIAYVILGPGSLMLMMTDNNRLNLINAIFTLILSLSLDLALIPKYGAVGAAIAGAITIVFVNILRLFQIHKVLGMHPYDLSYRKPVLAGIGATVIAVIAVGWLADVFYLWRLLIISGIVLLVYCGLILALQLEKTDQELFQALLYRFGRQQRSN